MTIDKAISILSQAAHGHTLTTGAEFYEACRMAVVALTRQQQQRAGRTP